MTVIQLHCEDELLAAELVTQVLAFAQARRLGVEHNCIKDRLVLYRGGTSNSESEPAAVPPSRSNIIAFPASRTVRRPTA
ncbi:MAG: hypothetical protein JWR07_5502 [Nevskia sp.]|nr:hypothetical protein [Nevskia sp.]